LSVVDQHYSAAVRFIIETRILR